MIEINMEYMKIISELKKRGNNNFYLLSICFKNYNTKNNKL